MNTAQVSVMMQVELRSNHGVEAGSEEGATAAELEDPFRLAIPFRIRRAERLLGIPLPADAFAVFGERGGCTHKERKLVWPGYSAEITI